MQLAPIEERLEMNYFLLTATTAQAFNLNCTGTFYGTDISPFSYTYRLDLSQKKWCGGDCTRIFDFAEISPNQLTFENEKKETRDGPQLTVSSVDRISGIYTRLHKWRSSINRKPMDIEWIGQCEPGPFTGFPLVPTKF